MAALFCTHSPPIDRISIRGDLAGSLGFVSYADPAHRYVVTQGQLLDQICTLFGGREAEVLCLNDLSIGSSSDLDRATAIARALVEEFGMGGETVGVRRLERRSNEDIEPSEALKGHAEAEVRRILEEQRTRAGRILRDNRALVETLRDLLVEKKVLDREALGAFFPAGMNKNPVPTEG